MGNDTDRLAQMEDNFNAGDSVYEALGLQMQTQRDLAKFIEQEHQNDKYRLKILSNGEPLNSSGLARIKKEIVSAQADTLQEIILNN